MNFDSIDPVHCAECLTRDIPFFGRCSHKIKSVEKVVAVLTAFLDESGTHDKGVCVTVAGFYGNDDQWKMFREFWKPDSDGFHALNSTSRFSKLCEVIEASKIHGIFTTIWKANYRELATEQMRSSIGNPYAVCAFLCAMQICEEVNNELISIVYEQGQPNFEFVKRILDAMSDAGDCSIGSVTSAKKSDYIELHAADFVSHCSSSHEKPPLQRLFDAGLLKHGHVTTQMLTEIGPMLMRIMKRARHERLKAKRQRP